MSGSYHDWYATRVPRHQEKFPDFANSISQTEVKASNRQLQGVPIPGLSHHPSKGGTKEADLIWGCPTSTLSSDDVSREDDVSDPRTIPIAGGRACLESPDEAGDSSPQDVEEGSTPPFSPVPLSDTGNLSMMNSDCNAAAGGGCLPVPRLATASCFTADFWGEIEAVGITLDLSDELAEMRRKAREMKERRRKVLRGVHGPSHRRGLSGAHLASCVPRMDSCFRAMILDDLGAGGMSPVVATPEAKSRKSRAPVKVPLEQLCFDKEEAEGGETLHQRSRSAVGYALHSDACKNQTAAGSNTQTTPREPSTSPSPSHTPRHQRPQARHHHSGLRRSSSHADISKQRPASRARVSGPLTRSLCLVSIDNSPEDKSMGRKGTGSTGAKATGARSDGAGSTGADWKGAKGTGDRIDSESAKSSRSIGGREGVGNVVAEEVSANPKREGGGRSDRRKGCEDTGGSRKGGAASTATKAEQHDVTGGQLPAKGVAQRQGETRGKGSGGQVPRRSKSGPLTSSGVKEREKVSRGGDTQKEGAKERPGSQRESLPLGDGKPPGSQRSLARSASFHVSRESPTCSIQGDKSLDKSSSGRSARTESSQTSSKAGNRRKEAKEGSKREGKAQSSTKQDGTKLPERRTTLPRSQSLKSERPKAERSNSGAGNSGVLRRIQTLVGMREKGKGETAQRKRQVPGKKTKSQRMQGVKGELGKEGRSRGDCGVGDGCAGAAPPLEMASQPSLTETRSFQRDGFKEGNLSTAQAMHRRCTSGGDLSEAPGRDLNSAGMSHVNSEVEPLHVLRRSASLSRAELRRQGQSESADSFQEAQAKAELSEVGPALSSFDPVLTRHKKERDSKGAGDGATDRSREVSKSRDHESSASLKDSLANEDRPRGPVGSVSATLQTIHESRDFAGAPANDVLPRGKSEKPTRENRGIGRHAQGRGGNPELCHVAEHERARRLAEIAKLACTGAGPTSGEGLVVVSGSDSRVLWANGSAEGVLRQKPGVDGGRRALLDSLEGCSLEKWNRTVADLVSGRCTCVELRLRGSKLGHSSSSPEPAVKLFLLFCGERERERERGDEMLGRMGGVGEDEEEIELLGVLQGCQTPVL